MTTLRGLMWFIVGVAILVGCTIALAAVRDNLWIVTMGASWWLTWHAISKAAKG